jgi:hypothetical protein
MKRSLALSVLICVAFAHSWSPVRGQATNPAKVATVPSEGPKANPGRPTFTNPATLPPVGYLQFEQGAVQANTSPGLGHQFSISQVTKLAVQPRLMLEFISQPFASTAAADGPTRDTGDLAVAIQGIFIQGHTHGPTVALNYQHVIRSGSAPNLDIGSSSQATILLISGDLGETHYDTNFIASEQTNDRPTGTLRRAQFGQTACVSHAILSRLAGDRLGLSGELWHFTQPLPTTDIHSRPVARANAVGVLLSLAYATAPNLVLDVAVNRGLTSTSTQWQAIAGFTYLLPHRLWSQGSIAPKFPSGRHHNPHEQFNRGDETPAAGESSTVPPTAPAKPQ